MGQAKTYRNLYLENQVRDLRRQVVDYKAKNNYLYGRGAFGLITTYKIYSAAFTPTSGTYYMLTADILFRGDNVQRGVCPYVTIEMYGQDGQRIENDTNFAGANKYDIPPYVNQTRISVNGYSRYGDNNQPFYLLAKCYGNTTGSFDINVSVGSLERYV